VTAARRAGGQIVVFSPLPFSDRNAADLRGVGEPAVFVIPGRFHDEFFFDYLQAFPKTLFLAGEASIKDHPSWRLQLLSKDRPELDGFDIIKVEGMPSVQEHVFFHETTRSLIVADLLFNAVEKGGWLNRQLLKTAGMDDGPRASRLWRLCVEDCSKFQASLKQIRQWDFVRIIPGHGRVIEQDAKQVFERAFSSWLDKA